MPAVVRSGGPFKPGVGLSGAVRLAVHDNFSSQSHQSPITPRNPYKQTKYKLSESVTLPIPNLLS
jgi:hypothetical protein